MKSREISRSKIGPFSLACTDPYIGIRWEYQSIQAFDYPFSHIIVWYILVFWMEPLFAPWTFKHKTILWHSTGAKYFKPWHCIVRKPWTAGQDKKVLSRPFCPVLDKN